ncbi:MAG TPA: HypC/HybG/HupF family hydrogenase formation chaperone [Euzebyales bacterium]|nr:HypC/HybG/HupF family hydrogenase formation chaperone [Euzebyales bacterium]
MTSHDVTADRDLATTDVEAGTGALLPVLGTPPRTVPDTGAACAIDDDGCITCGDVAVALTVEEVGKFDALCRDDEGRTETVATELVGALTPGERVLVHAKVALERLAPVEGRR